MVKLFIIGRLGKDATTNQVGGNNVINFSVAHSDRYKDSSGNFKEKTVWVECAYWTDKVGVVPYLKKGKEVYVEGTPDVRNYTSNDGKAGASLTLRVQTIQLLGGKDDAGQENNMSGNMSASSSTNRPMTNSSSHSADIDDLPF